MKKIPQMQRAMFLVLSLPLLLAQAPGAEAGRGSDLAKVVRAEPIYRTVRHAVPREQCHLEDVRVHTARSGSAAAPVLGAIIGGAIGNAVASGKSNKRVGTVAGAALGGSIGYDMARRRAAEDGPVHYRTREVCTTVTTYREVPRIEGYHVTYRYQGRTYTTRMPYDPGKHLRVRVQVDPVF